MIDHSRGVSLDRLLAMAQLAPRRVHAQIAEAGMASSTWAPVRRISARRAGDQFAKLEGLDDVVVRAKVESVDPVVERRRARSGSGPAPFGRRLPGSRRRRNQLHPAHARKTEVEHDQVEVFVR